MPAWGFSFSLSVAFSGLGLAHRALCVRNIDHAQEIGFFFGGVTVHRRSVLWRLEDCNVCSILFIFRFSCFFVVFFSFFFVVVWVEVIQHYRTMSFMFIFSFFLFLVWQAHIMWWGVLKSCKHNLVLWKKKNIPGLVGLRSLLDLSKDQNALWRQSFCIDSFRIPYFWCGSSLCVLATSKNFAKLLVHSLARNFPVIQFYPTFHADICMKLLRLPLKHS